MVAHTVSAGAGRDGRAHEVLRALCDEYGLSPAELIVSLKSVDVVVPLGVLRHPVLAPLEAIVVYLRENKGFRLSDVAVLLGRDARVVGATYHAAKKKISPSLTGLVVVDGGLSIPVSVLRDDSLSVLEAVVVHLKNRHGLRLSEIARLLERDDRTVWTLYSRVVVKRGR